MVAGAQKARALTQSEICQCFNGLFGVAYNVELRGGGAEPDYIPPAPDQPGVLVARADFAASALHEAAHWCVAGAARRLQPDYGYLYLPPPRSGADQRKFFSWELRNQAVECYLSEAAGLPFRASADDPDLSLAALAAFEREVRARTAPQPPRAVQLAQALRGARHACR